MLHANQCPWNIPVPVKEGHFQPLFEEHAGFNIATDLAQIPAFGYRVASRPEHDNLLLADLQTNFGRHVRGRLGSGRSGFFRGSYLKGVGRTPLAANWDCKDYLHNSGHLPASAAIREYVASEYLRSRSLEKSIVPCCGLLLAPLNERLSSYHTMLYGNRAEQVVPSVDLSLQAISIKNGCFARPSNLLWLLHHLTPWHLQRSHSLSVLVELYAESLQANSGAPSLDPSELTPALLADMQMIAVNRAVMNFEAWFSVGTWWSSFANNFTLDGRFLDLETPAIAGGAIFGILRPCHDGVVASSSVIGAEAFIYLAQMKVFIQEMCRTLSCLPEWFDPVEREFAASLAAELAAKALDGETLISSAECAIDHVVYLIRSQVPNLSEDEIRCVHRIVAQEHSASFLCSSPVPENEAVIGAGTPHFPIESLPPVMVQPDFQAIYSAFGLSPQAQWHASPEEFQKGKAIAELMNELDACTSLEQLLRKLRQVPENMRQVETAFAS